MKNKSIQLRGISKVFDVGFRKNDGALAKAVSFISGIETKKELQVLKDVSLSVWPGQVIGLIGKNASGKSTLLRIIAEIYQPSSGSVETEGTVTYLSGFSNGLNLKLTMEENIYLMGAIMGLTQKEVEEKFDKIVEFSGLKDFVFTKVHQFSSGMITRLAFSVTIHCLSHKKPDILLLDEIFGAGGDLDFESKAINKMAEFIKGGSTVILASHNLKVIEDYCDVVMLLDKGVIIKTGKPYEIIDYYQKTFSI